MEAMIILSETILNMVSKLIHLSGYWISRTMSAMTGRYLCLKNDDDYMLRFSTRMPGNHVTGNM